MHENKNHIIDYGREWKLSPSGYLYIEHDVLDVIYKYRQVGINSNESGGLLIGYFRGVHLHITQLTTPLPKDRANRYRFFREDPMHIQILQKLHTESNGELNLLGEWHTHPEFNPTPSSIDRQEWAKIQSIRKEQSTVFLIAGTISNWVGKCNGEKLPMI